MFRDEIFMVTSIVLNRKRCKTNNTGWIDIWGGNN